MVHRVQLLSKLVLVGYLLSCCVSDNSTLNIYNEKAVSTYQKRGIRFVNDKIFTGILIQIDEISGDTISFNQFLKGKKEGEWWKKYDSENYREIRHFQDGKKEGLYQGWWSNGQLKFEYHFKNDEYQGSCKEWNFDGLLIREMHYKQGHEEGSQKVWYDTGKIKSNYVVKNGRRYGLLGTKNCVSPSNSIRLD